MWREKKARAAQLLLGEKGRKEGFKEVRTFGPEGSLNYSTKNRRAARD